MLNRRKVSVTGVIGLLFLSTVLLASTATVGYSETDKFTADLYAGQSIYVGHVDVWNEGLDTLHVEYVLTESDWYIVETQVSIGAALDDIPQHNGNPAPGQFDYKHTYYISEEVTIDSFEIDISGDGFSWGDDVYIATHATVKRVVDGEVVQTETAWSGDFDFPGKNWATYVMFLLTEDENGGDEVLSSETAWAGIWDDKNDNDVIDMDKGRSTETSIPYYSQSGKDKGNWALWFQYTMGDGDVDFDLIAGQTMIAGVVTVSSSGDILYLVIDTNDDWDLDACHIHVEVYDGERPDQEPVPGQFEVIESYSQPKDAAFITIYDWDDGDSLAIMVHAVVWH